MTKPRVINSHKMQQKGRQPHNAQKRAVINMVCFVFTREPNLVLVQTRSGPANFNGHDYRGQNVFPGGKTEPDETVWATLVRELKEELGLTTITAHSMALYTQAGTGWIFQPYLVSDWTGELPDKVLDTGDPLTWVPVESLFASELNPTAEIARDVQTFVFDRPDNLKRQIGEFRDHDRLLTKNLAGVCNALADALGLKVDEIDPNRLPEYVMELAGRVKP